MVNEYDKVNQNFKKMRGSQFEEEELKEKATIKEFLIVQYEGNLEAEQ